MPSRSPSTFCASGVPGPCTWQSDGSATVALYCRTSCTHSARFCGSCRRGKIRSTRAPKGTGSIVWPGPSAHSSAPFLFVTVGGWYRRLLLRPLAPLHPPLSSRPSWCSDTFVGVSAGSVLRFVGCPCRGRHGVRTPSLRRGDLCFTVVGCRVSGPRPSADGLGPRLAPNRSDLFRQQFRSYIHINCMRSRTLVGGMKMWGVNNFQNSWRQKQVMQRTKERKKSQNTVNARPLILNPKRHPKILHRSPMGATLFSSALISTAKKPTFSTNFGCPYSGQISSYRGRVPNHRYVDMGFGQAHGAPTSIANGSYTLK